MNPLIFSVLQAGMVCGLAPLMLGMVRTAKARLQNRRGASIFQPYWALLSLGRKEMTMTRQASWIFRAVPFVVLASALLLACVIPTLGTAGAAKSLGNIFFVAAVLAIGAVFLVFGGMDVGSAFGGMGSSREMTLAALAEPALVMSLVTFGFAARTWNLTDMLAAFVQTPWPLAHPFMSLAVLSFGFVLLAENARYPVDNPATHLELTMVHEAMILEYSGPYLAMLEWASAIKLTALSLLCMNILIPVSGAAMSGWSGLLWAGVSLLAKLVLAASLIAGVETLLVKMRFYRMQEYLTSAYFLGLAGFVLSLVF